MQALEDEVVSHFHAWVSPITGVNSIP